MVNNEYLGVSNLFAGLGFGFSIAMILQGDNKFIVTLIFSVIISIFNFIQIFSD